MRLAGKVAVVTGGGSGIGRAIARHFGAEGASVVLCGRRRELIDAAAADIRSKGGHATAVSADVTSAADASNVIAAAATSYGRLDILVNCTGAMLSRTSVTECSEDDWDRTISVNLTSGFLCSKSAIPELIKTRGNILFISSVFALIGGIQRAAYVAAKGGITSLVRGMALDFAKHGIRVNAICPAYIETEINRELLAESRRSGEFETILRQHPLGRLGTPDDVAHAAIYLASDEARWVTGIALAVDGGMTAGRG